MLLGCKMWSVAVLCVGWERGRACLDMVLRELTMYGSSKRSDLVRFSALLYELLKLKPLMAYCILSLRPENGGSLTRLTNQPVHDQTTNQTSSKAPVPSASLLARA